MTDEMLLFEVRYRIETSPKKRVTYNSLEKLKNVDFAQLARVIKDALETGRLRSVNGELYVPAPAPRFGEDS